MVVDIDDNNIHVLCKLFDAIRDGNGNLQEGWNGFSHDSIDDFLWKNDLKDYFVSEDSEDEETNYSMYEEYAKFVLSIPIGTWNVSRVTNMNQIFSYMSFAFEDAKYYSLNDDGSLLQELEFLQEDDVMWQFPDDVETHQRHMTEQFLDNWNVSNVTDMSGMFYACNNLTTFINVQCNWDTSRVTTMEGMFEYCVKLTGLSNFDHNIFERWNVSRVVNTGSMFRHCRKFNADISMWDVRSLKDARRMFRGCKEFDQDLSSWRLYNHFYINAMEDPRNPDPRREEWEWRTPRSSDFMFTAPMKDLPNKWPRLVDSAAPPLPPLPVGPPQGPKCMSKDDYDKCEKDEEGVVIDAISMEELRREDAVKFKTTPQCISRKTLRQLHNKKNPFNPGELFKEAWLKENTKEGDCVEAATGGRRRRGRKTKKAHKQKRRGGSRKGRKAGRRTRNAKKYAKKPKATRRHRRK